MRQRDRTNLGIYKSSGRVSGRKGIVRCSAGRCGIEAVCVRADGDTLRIT